MKDPHGDKPAWRQYLEDVKAIPKKAENGRNELVESHLLFVFSIAREYSKRGIPMEDLLSEGNVGLLEAAARFDPTKGAAFATYASWWIRKRILNLIARQQGVIRLPKYKLERLKHLRSAEMALSARLSRSPSVEELALETGLSRQEVESLRVIKQREMSLDHVVHDDSGRTIGESVSAGYGEPAAQADDGVIEHDFEEFLNRVLESLAQDEQFVIRGRFGFGGGPPETLQTISERLGMSREGVRQVEMRAIQKIRRFLDGRLNLPPQRRKAPTLEDH